VARAHRLLREITRIVLGLLFETCREIIEVPRKIGKAQREIETSRSVRTAWCLVAVIWNVVNLGPAGNLLVSNLFLSGMMSSAAG